jgi:hypothetical protein
VVVQGQAPCSLHTTVRWDRAVRGRRLSAVLIVGMMLVYFVVELGWGGGTKHDWSHRPNMKQIHRRKRSGRPG